MVGRGAAMAGQFEQVVAEFTEVVEGLSVEQWVTLCPDEGRTVGRRTILAGRDVCPRGADEDSRAMDRSHSLRPYPGSSPKHSGDACAWLSRGFSLGWA